MKRHSADMNGPSVDLTKFDLPFSTEDGGGSEVEEDAYAVLDDMRKHLPDSVVLVGVVECDVQGWTTWKIHSEYYVLPLDEDTFALFRLDWDDNWGRWEWCADARVTGAGGPWASARLMLEALWNDWQLDVDEEGNEAYRELIDSIP